MNRTQGEESELELTRGAPSRQTAKQLQHALQCAALRMRVCGIDMLVGPSCSGTRRVPAAIHDPGFGAHGARVAGADRGSTGAGPDGLRGVRDHCKPSLQRANQQNAWRPSTGRPPALLDRHRPTTVLSLCIAKLARVGGSSRAQSCSGSWSRSCCGPHAASAIPTRRRRLLPRPGPRHPCRLRPHRPTRP